AGGRHRQGAAHPAEPAVRRVPDDAGRAWPGHLRHLRAVRGPLAEGVSGTARKGKPGMLDVAVVAHSRKSFGGGLPELRKVLDAEGVTAHPDDGLLELGVVPAKNTAPWTSAGSTRRTRSNGPGSPSASCSPRSGLPRRQS